jgi:UDP-N-acetylglucosamine--N-acetylmuramyl-(pentapeptide) pyrophosphoryl-undecaprenol N-acetylglucosamine transferase
MAISKPYRLIISGGGTGGHIFPAIAIANEFKERYPDAQILFVGARGKMEMKRVPDAGYKIIGLWISGLQRKLTWQNILFPVKVVVSIMRANAIINKIKPHVVIGTGGYASGPMMMAATRRGIPTLIQEQNSFAGMANKRVADKASCICVAYEGMEKYFPSEKIRLTGNPVRKDILSVPTKRDEAFNFFGLDRNTKTLLIVGGSLGARTINESIIEGIEKLVDAKVQVIWQTGKGYFDLYQHKIESLNTRKFIVKDFIKEMDLAYAAADVVISRSGALAVSELCVAQKPVILVPSPNVAEDHQSKNAQALVDRQAAVLVTDAEAKTRVVDEALKLLFDEQRCDALKKRIAQMAKPDATHDIVDLIEKILGIGNSVKVEKVHV